MYEHDVDNGIVCFHCQQAIEKYLKGFLTITTGELQEGHNLVKLCKKAIAYDKALGEFIKDMAFVNTYYIETRYPAEDPLLINKEDAEECIKIAMKVIGGVFYGSFCNTEHERCIAHQLKNMFQMKKW